MTTENYDNSSNKYIQLFRFFHQHMLSYVTETVNNYLGVYT